MAESKIRAIPLGAKAWLPEQSSKTDVRIPGPRHARQTNMLYVATTQYSFVRVVRLPQKTRFNSLRLLQSDLLTLCQSRQTGNPRVKPPP